MTTSNALADKGGVLVVHLMGNAIRPRLCGDEFHFVDESSSPRLVNASAEFSFQAFELFLPRFSVRHDREAAPFTPERARMSRESFSDDARPCRLKPRESRFGFAKAARDASEKFSRSFHEAGILAQTDK